MPPLKPRVFSVTPPCSPPHVLLFSFACFPFRVPPATRHATRLKPRPRPLPPRVLLRWARELHARFVGRTRRRPVEKGRSPVFQEPRARGAEAAYVCAARARARARCAGALYAFVRESNRRKSAWGRGGGGTTTTAGGWCPPWRRPWRRSQRRGCCSSSSRSTASCRRRSATAAAAARASSGARTRRSWYAPYDSCVRSRMVKLCWSPIPSCSLA